MATFHFDLVSPARLIFSGEVTQVDVPGVEGDFGVLAGHAPTVAMVKPGVLTVFAEGGAKHYIVFGGFAEVSPTALTVLADASTTLDDADRDALTARITELEAVRQKLAGTGKFDERKQLDRAIERLDHYYALERRLQGGAPAAH